MNDHQAVPRQAPLPATHAPPPVEVLLLPPEVSVPVQLELKRVLGSEGHSDGQVVRFQLLPVDYPLAARRVRVVNVGGVAARFAAIFAAS